MYRVNLRDAMAVYLHTMAVATRFRCPCCDYRTLDAPAAMGPCPVCWWEDDGQDDADAFAVHLTVNGPLSLAEAHQHYASCRAAHPRFRPYVRKPDPTEQ